MVTAGFSANFQKKCASSAKIEELLNQDSYDTVIARICFNPTEMIKSDWAVFFSVCLSV